jgi:G3E family GTPase
MKHTPINVVTGFLGSGKTTIIMKLLEQIDNPESVVWLKNEYGNLNVDKKLVEQTHVQTKEIMNGCLCCVLVGRLGDALDEIKEKYDPSRIIVESSGTAYPAPIVLEINKLDNMYVDSVVNVIDVVNFSGYDDLSYAAKNQSEYIDLIVLNKWPADLESGSKRELDIEHRLDDVYELNLKTPKIKTVDGFIDVDLVFGIGEEGRVYKDFGHLREGEGAEHNHIDEPDVIEMSFPSEKVFDPEEVDKKLDELKSKGYIRIKGIVNTKSGVKILNWIFGRGTWIDSSEELDKTTTEIVFMGKNLKQSAAELREFIEN